MHFNLFCLINSMIKNHVTKLVIAIIIILSTSFTLLSQQHSDPDFIPQIKKPAYTNGRGPVIFIDEDHYNFHTLEGRYKPFAELLEKDGYVLKPFRDKFISTDLGYARILVISNALNRKNIEEWTLPTPSAFTKDEIIALVDWVKDGGSLFLIADHMPMPGAVSELASKFGFKMNNGFAFDTTDCNSPTRFSRSEKTLRNNIITNGRDHSEKIDSVFSFTGQAFQIPNEAIPILIFNNNFISFMPDTAWVFNKSTKRIPVGGWSQGAVIKFGEGKVAVWGEAAMFTAQKVNDEKFGMNSPFAIQNAQLLLNLMHWLDGIIY